MSKRVRFSEEVPLTKKLPKYEDNPTSSKAQSDLPGSRFKENHSIDSDEEDNDSTKGEEFERLTEEDVEGAENEEISGDFSEEGGGSVITPFNLKEEMTEGSFDKDGHYHFKKEKEIRDNWLDNINWQENFKAPKTNPTAMNIDDVDPEPFNELKIIEGIVELLQKGETVSKGLRRLGGGHTKKKKSRSWQREKVYDLQADGGDAEEEEKEVEASEEERKKQFLLLTELADQMAGSGHYDIYTDTFEKLQFKLNSLQVSNNAKRPEIPDTADDDDALDIFADDIDGKEDVKSGAKTDSSEPQKANNDSENDTSTKWQYKWNEKESEVFGPFTSSEMAQWKSQGYFKEGVVVRRTDRPDSMFYNAARMDFDLYD